MRHEWYLVDAIYVRDFPSTQNLEIKKSTFHFTTRFPVDGVKENRWVWGQTANSDRPTR